MTIITLRIGTNEVIESDQIEGYTLGPVSTIRLKGGLLIETTQPVTVRTRQTAADVFVPMQWGVGQDERNSLVGGK